VVEEDREMEEKQPAQVVAVDGSEQSERAFRWACKWTPSDHTLVLVHGIHRPEPPVPLIEAGQERWMRKQWSRALEEHEFMESARLMNRYQHLCKKNGRKCEWMAVPYRTPSELSENICNAAQRSGASNIVCGSRGLGTLERALLGSTSSSLVHHCPANVSVIKE